MSELMPGRIPELIIQTDPDTYTSACSNNNDCAVSERNSTINKRYTITSGAYVINQVLLHQVLFNRPD
ncbi:MAG: hypothetical protein OEX07_02070 [Gammaproteobacteria bacterium]|nr:hypothetical protein [Gammaproteobacteria bacterium]